MPGRATLVGTAPHASTERLMTIAVECLLPLYLAVAGQAPTAAPVPAAPLRVAVAAPVDLDLRGAAAADWLPGDVRDPGQVEAVRRRWVERLGPLRAAGAVRILLPSGPDRVPLLLAAAQALGALAPAAERYVAFDPEAAPLWDETAWGAVQGGALLPADLGPEPERWRERLKQAQGQFPGRPWSLWLAADPGPGLAQLLGDGGRPVVPAETAAAQLAAAWPAGCTEVAGASGRITLRDPRTGAAAGWAWSGGGWRPAPVQSGGAQAGVVAPATYDVGALLARMRSAQAADQARLHTREGRVELDLHLQAELDPGIDLGMGFLTFEAAGEPEEWLQREMRFNGVDARLHGGINMPIVESRYALQPPAVLNLAEHYRYQDGGAAGPGRRRLRFQPVAADPLLFSGELLVDEASGRVLEERSQRENLPGIVQSERRTLRYSDAGDGTWRLVELRSYERWLMTGSVTQVQRTLRYDQFRTNQPGFAADRAAARDSDGTMWRQTVNGMRYYNKQADGSRQTEPEARSTMRAVAAILLVDPTLGFPVTPLGGLFYMDFDALHRGIQVDALTALVYNRGRVTVPLGSGPGRWDLTADSTSMFLNDTERPIVHDRLQDQDAVGRRYATLDLAMAHDLGAGFRFQGAFLGQQDWYGRPAQSKYWTTGYTLPPSGQTGELRAVGSWLHKGFQLTGYEGRGRRPDGDYGDPGQLTPVPDRGRFSRWGASAGYDLALDRGSWLHLETGWASGSGFDRFKAIAVDGVDGDVCIAGLRTGAVAADRVAYGKAALVLPSGPRTRFTLSLDHAEMRNLDDRSMRGFTGLGAAGDLPGFGWFTYVRVDLGVGLQSDLPGARSVNGYVALLRVF